MLLSYPQDKYNVILVNSDYSLFQFCAISDTVCTLVRKDIRLEKSKGNRIVPCSPFSIATSVFFSLATHLRDILLFISSTLLCARENTRDAIVHTPPQFEHCRGLIGSYRAVMSHNGADNARDNTPPASRDYPAFLTRGTHPPTHPPSTSLLSWNQHIPPT